MADRGDTSGLIHLFASWLSPAAPLAHLLTARPDLALPPPADLAELSRRALSHSSIARAVDGLDRTHLLVLEAVASLGLHTAAQISTFFGVEHDTDLPDDVLHTLGDLALILPTEAAGHWQTPAAVSAAVGTATLGLGRPASGLGAAPESLPTTRPGTEQLIDAHPLVQADPGLASAVHHGLDTLQSQPVARLSDSPGPVLQVLLDTGLLVPAGHSPEGTALAEHPLEAALAWRDGTAGNTLSRTAPNVPGTPVLRPITANASLAAIADLLRQAGQMLTAVQDGVPTLRSGGVGVRQLKALADQTGTDPERASWLVELLVAAGLVELDPDTSRWRPSPAASPWRRAGRAHQWGLLVSGWLGSGRAPLWGPPLAGPGRAEPTGRLLAPDRTRPDGPRLRATVLETAAVVHTHQPGIPLEPAVTQRLRWLRPRQSHRVAAFVPSLLHEMGLLGLTGAGALTEIGLLVAQGDLDASAALLAEQLPAPIQRVHLQGDLTAIAPGYLAPRVAEALELMADTEGDGAAQLYRFSDASLHRAFDAGWTADRLVEFLTDHAAGEVPQALSYLVRDVARRHGSVVTGPATAWLRVEEPSVLDTLLADPAVALARLERIAPTVVIAAVGPRELQRILAAAGHRAALAVAPVPPAPDIQIPDDEDHEQPPRTPFPEPVTAIRRRPTPEEIEQVLDRLRTAPTPRPGSDGPEQAVAVLRQAARTRRPVRLEMVSARGERQQATVIPVAVTSGRLRYRRIATASTATASATEGSEALLPLHRVISAVAQPAPGA